jgi:hypothetical protein
MKKFVLLIIFLTGCSKEKPVEQPVKNPLIAIVDTKIKVKVTKVVYNNYRDIVYFCEDSEGKKFDFSSQWNVKVDPKKYLLIKKTEYIFETYTEIYYEILIMVVPIQVES